MISRFGPLLAGAVLLTAPVLEAAGNHSILPPVLGYVFDQQTGSLHRINGIPGASSMGEALDLGFTVSRATISANQRLAIVRDARGRTYSVDLNVVPPSATEIQGVLDGATEALISPSARLAALYSPATGRLQFLDGLPGVPTPGTVVEVGRGRGSWTTFAISDSGAVLAANSDGGSGALFLLRPNRMPERIGGVRRVSWLAFRAGTDDVVVTDAGAGEVLLFRDVVGRRQMSVLASEADEVGNAFAAAPTSDGRFVVAAMPGRVASIPVAGGVPAFIECACTATSMTPLGGGNSFLLTEDVRSPMTIVEIGTTSRALFVPALPADPETAQVK